MSERLTGQSTDVEIDMRALLRTLFWSLPLVVIFAGLVGAGAFYGLSRIPPSYKSETTILIEEGESDLTKTQTSGGSTATVLDNEAITSQVQLIRSRDLARIVVDKLNLASLPEYQKAVKGESLVGDFLARLGLAKDPAGSSVEERLLAAYYDKLQVTAIDNSRVIAIDYSSTDPKLAAEAANTIAAEYISMERAAKRDTTVDATKWLEGEIADLRVKVKDAEAKVEAYRSANNLLIASGATQATLPQQQLADLSAELTRVRAARVEASSKATQIKASLKSGTIPNISDVLNSPLIQRLIEQQVSLRATIAEQSATLLPGHPRMKELTAQLADLNGQVYREAQKIVAALEGEAQLSLARESEIADSLEKLKSVAANAGEADVQLRALEREAAAQRDLLDTYLRRYREALARQNVDFLPADARIISTASVPITPDFPKPIPMTAAATVAAFLLAIAFVLIRELASGRPMRPVTIAPVALPAVPDAVPVEARVRWADDRGIRRMMPSEPTLAPPIPGRSERALASVAEQVVAHGWRKIVVTLAEGSATAGRPLPAVALARALVRADRRVLLVDLHNDGADGAIMGQGSSELPGFTDLFAGEASFAQVIFRDRRSRAHLIPAGRQPVSASSLSAERLGTIFNALDHTYDHVILDIGDSLIDKLAPTANAAIVVSEFAPSDPRTVRAFDRIATVSPATILLLAVDPASEAELDAAMSAGEAA